MTALNHDLLHRLFRDHRAAIVAFLLRRVECPEAALDLSQEAWLRLLRKECLDHGDNVPAYLFKIAERLAIDWLRRERRVFLDIHELGDELPCPRPPPDQLALLRQQCAILLDAIASLPRTCRNVFLLRKIDDLSYGEIAARLGISEKTVQRHLVKAMLRCHERLREAPP